MRIRFPDSEICGSKGARPSPQLIAACYVLHRLCVPRHPPDALALTLDRSAIRSMPRKKASVRTTPYTAFNLEMVFMRSVLSVVLRSYRLCKPAQSRLHNVNAWLSDEPKSRASREFVWRVARLTLSKLIVFSVVTTCCAFEPQAWWSQTGSNRRPHACKARALPTELWPRLVVRGNRWWARDELNVRPHAYQACALTT